MAAPSPDRLDSWKEIAAYLGRGVRTVRRWETEEGLPVHRHMHRALGSVYAFKSEIDRWQSGGRRRAPAAGGAAAGAPEATNSIAVLPFTNVGDDPANAYFADGLSAEVIADLSKVRALRVISRMSSRAFSGTDGRWKQVAAALRVRYILEGSVQRAGDRLRITAQLIDADEDRHLWGDKYDGSVADVFAIQERLARKIVDALKLQLSVAEDQGLAERPIGDLRAYECYLRARHEGWRWRKDAIDRAVGLLRDGLDIVGDNARLHAALGLAYLQYREAGIDLGPQPLEEATACATRVLSIAPASAPGMQLRGWIRYSSGEIQDAVRDLKAAHALEPNDPDTLLLLSNCYLISGKVAAARPLIGHLLAVDPLTPVTRCMPAWADILEGNLDAGLEAYRQMLQMDPGNPMARLFYVWVLALNRQADAAAATTAGFSPELRDTAPAAIAGFFVEALQGRRPSRVLMAAAERQVAASNTDVLPRFLGQAYALAGLQGPAVRWLNAAVDRGFINYPFLAEYDPFLVPMRGRPAFRSLLQVVHDRWQAFEA